MTNLDYKFFYQRHLPHYQPEDATLFITFRLANSIPQVVIGQLNAEAERVDAVLSKIANRHERAEQAYLEQRKLFAKWDTALDAAQSGPTWLKDQRIAALLSESLHYPDTREYELIVFCIMPNHGHLVCSPLKDIHQVAQPLQKIMHSLKGRSARKANLILARSGKFWQHENYDHVVRNEAELKRIVRYVVNNPVKAGLVDKPEDWKWTYSKYGM
jgi:REP element-mobilizing transposase RayT